MCSHAYLVGKILWGITQHLLKKKTGTGMCLFALRKFALPMNETTV